MDIFTGCSVEVIDKTHAMCGRRGIVTSPAMWSRPIYKPIPKDSYRVEMESDNGRFYGDYHRTQLKIIRCPGGVN